MSDDHSGDDFHDLQTSEMMYGLYRATIDLAHEAPYDPSVVTSQAAKARGSIIDFNDTDTPQASTKSRKVADIVAYLANKPA